MRSYQSYLSDEQLERLLEKGAASLDQPPAEVVQDVTPWRRAMGCIIVGTALSLLTLKFLFLNYILPTVGLTMLVLGFRALRRENGWFKVAYLLSIYRCAQTVCILIASATIYTVPIEATLVRTFISLAPQYLIYVCLWRGLLAVQRKAGVEVGAPGAGGLIIWYMVLLCLAVVNYNGWLVLIAMVVVYIILLRTLNETAKTLDEAGYDVKIAPVRVQDGVLCGAVAVIIVVGILLGHFFGSKYPMDWRLRDEAASAEVAAIKEELLALGYPDYALDDLTAEDILACQGAGQVISDTKEFTQAEYTNYANVEKFQGDLLATGVAVKLPEEDRWRFFHHFHWKQTKDGVDPEFHGTNALKIWPVDRDLRYWHDSSEFSGQVLYTKEQAVYTAPYHYLGEKSYTSQDIFFGTQHNVDLFATFSMPAKFCEQRGYVGYSATVTPQEEFTHISTWCNFIHQTDAFLYPGREAMDVGFWSDGFFTPQYALQCTIYENGTVEIW